MGEKTVKNRMYEKKYKKNLQKWKIKDVKNEKKNMKFYKKRNDFLYNMFIVIKNKWEKSRKEGIGIVQIGEKKRQ